MAKNKTKQIPVTNKNTGKTSELQGPISSSYSPESEIGKLEGTVTSEINDTPEKPKESIEELVQGFFIGKIKSLPNDRIKKLKKHIFEIESSAELLTEAVKNDLALEKAKSLLLILDKHKTYPVFQTSISKFIRDLIAQHPIMISHNIDKWLPLDGASEQLGLIKLFEEISPAKNIKNNSVTVDEKSDVKVESALQKSRLNLFYIALIWRIQKNFINFNDFVRSLRATVFSSNLSQLEIEHLCIDFLTDSHDKDISKISALMDWYTNELDNGRKSVREATNKAEQLTLQLSNTNLLIATLQSTNNIQLNKIDELTSVIAATNEARRVDSIHANAGQSSEKGRVLRLMEGEIKILENCRTALQKNPPKAAIADQLISNVIENLQAELLNLRG